MYGGCRWWVRGKGRVNPLQYKSYILCVPMETYLDEMG